VLLIVITLNSYKNCVLVSKIKPETKWSNYGQVEFKAVTTYWKTELVYVAKY